MDLAPCSYPILKHTTFGYSCNSGIKFMLIIAATVPWTLVPTLSASVSCIP